MFCIFLNELPVYREIRVRPSYIQKRVKNSSVYIQKSNFADSCSVETAHHGLTVKSENISNVTIACGHAQPKLDNARVNRADEKCKLVKMESDTMGGTTIRRLANRKG